jgi:hypothetical protein
MGLYTVRIDNFVAGCGTDSHICNRFSTSRFVNRRGEHDLKGNRYVVKVGQLLILQESRVTKVIQVSCADCKCNKQDRGPSRCAARTSQKLGKIANFEVVSSTDLQHARRETRRLE